MYFEWDERKNAENLRKHGVRFEDAAPLFVQEMRYTYRSKHSGSDVERLVTVGPMRGKLFAVVYTTRGDTIRIISVRRARHEEEKRYHTLQFGRIH